MLSSSLPLMCITFLAFKLCHCRPCRVSCVRPLDSTCTLSIISEPSVSAYKRSHKAQVSLQFDISRQKHYFLVKEVRDESTDI